MTPGNYCVHAVEQLQGVHRWLTTVPAAAKDADWMRIFIQSLLAAEKFLLPVNGRLLDDSQEPEEVVKNLRLPFGCIAAEFYCDKWNAPAQVLDNQTESSKRIVYCLEHPQAEGYWVTTIDYIDKDQQWQLSPLMMLIRYHLDLRQAPISSLDRFAQHYVSEQAQKTGMVDAFDVRFQVTMPWIVENTLRHRRLQREDYVNSVLAEITSDWRAIVDLTNVLACQNAITEKVGVSPKLNKKRVALGKLPYDSYHILKIRADRPVAPRTAPTGTHASPRQHVRRGHIRTYRRDEPDRRYTRFIQQMLVGDPSKGRVEKDYEMVK